MTRLIEEYDGEIPCIDSSWLREELSKLRCLANPRVGDYIRDDPWRDWRVNAGVVNAKGKANKAKTLTKRQAALIVMQSLWKPRGGEGIKTLLQSSIAVNQLSRLNVRPLFDEWALLGHGPAQDILNLIYETPESLTAQELAELAPKLTGKVVTLVQIRRWLPEEKDPSGAISRRGVWKVLEKFRQIADNHSSQKRSA